MTRLEEMIQYLEKKFQSEIAGLRERVKSEIIVRGRTEFTGVNTPPAVLALMEQV